MYYKYLPCQILSHDFDEKSDFLNYEFSIRLLAINWPSSKERVGSGEDVTLSNRTTQQLDGIRRHNLFQGKCRQKTHDEG